MTAGRGNPTTAADRARSVREEPMQATNCPLVEILVVTFGVIYIYESTRTR